MSLLTCNGQPVVGGILSFPPVGNWFASLEVASTEAISGAVRIADSAVTLSGTTIRSGYAYGLARVDVVGGKGGLRRDVPARHFSSTTARVVAADTIAAAGEALDGKSSGALLGSRLPFWSRYKGSASEALSTLAASLGGVWRVMDSGAVWFGTEAWPKAPESMDGTELDRDGAAGTVTIAPDTIALRPGFALSGTRVGRVEHYLEPDGPLRTVFWVSE